MPVRAAELHFIRLEDLSPVHGLHIQLAQTTSDKEKASGCLNLTRRSLHFQDNIYTLWLLTYKASFFILEGLGFPSGLASKVSTCSAGDAGRRVRFLGLEDPQEEGMATHSSLLAWKIPWIEKPGGPQSMGLRKLNMT